MKNNRVKEECEEKNLNFKLFSTFESLKWNQNCVFFETLTPFQVLAHFKTKP